jgi:hypothetical protein
MGTVTVEAQHELSAITATGNLTPHTIQFTNPTTAFTTTGNVSVGKELSVTGNVVVDTDTLFVDSVNDRVGVGKTDPATALDVVGTVTATAFAGNATTASALAASVNIGGVAFDGSAAIVPTTFTTATFSGDVAFDTNTLFVDSTNNRVGVGTASPQYRLDVGHGGGGAADDVMLRVMSSSSTSGKLIFGRSGTADIRSHAIETYNSSGADNNYMKFLVHDGTGISPYETRTEVMTLRGDGNVGIGTTSPDASLHVAGTGAIVVPSGTTALQPTGVTGMIRFNTDVGKLEFYNGTVWSTIGGVNATGGAVTNVNGYTIHTFTSSDTFTVNLGGEIEYLVVAGGGGGGASWEGGGGGAGGLMTGTVAISSGSYTITRGAGGVGGRGSGASAMRVPTNGSNSSFSGFVALGGGVGGQNTPAQYPTGGGSGGGGTHTRVTPGNATGSGQFGNTGGLGIANTLVGAGGGGAGAVGQGPTASKGGDGGVGKEIFGSYYAGGGGGARRSNAASTSGSGGSGGGGNGGTAGQSGTANTGGGGGGGAGGTNSIGGDGGSGIVIIRYL